MKKKMLTTLIHGAHFSDPNLSVTMPIYQTSTFSFKSAEHGADCFAGRDNGYIYTRLGNPTVRALEETLAELEGGVRAIAFASGMGAVSTLFMALLGQGRHIVCSATVYGATRGVLESQFKRYGVEMTFVDTSDIESVKAAMQPNTVMVYTESPANPTMAMTDLQAVADLTHAHKALFVVDNTFCSPYLQRPFEHGADIVLHSLTKFLNGHADIVGGALIAKDPEVGKTLYKCMTVMGPNMDPHQAFLALRGIRTLAVRMDRSQENAQKVAEFLEAHPQVAWVKYPGLKSHPQYELGKRQMDGPGAMISFGLKGGYEAGKKAMDNVKVAALAVSLGGVESLIQHPASMTHAGMSAEAKLVGGITDDLIRFSVGIEDVDDIIADLKQAIEQ
jgi:methionine-gamma-lyase